MPVRKVERIFLWQLNSLGRIDTHQEILKVAAVEDVTDTESKIRNLLFRNNIRPKKSILVGGTLDVDFSSTPTGIKDRVRAQDILENP